MNLDDHTFMHDIKIQDQPTGYNYNAPLPNGVTNIRIRLYWEPPEPVFIGRGPATAPRASCVRR
eukprot:8181901-Pyramimonas_sp.AAC.1